ncbi:MAG TPA: hypothetical protein VK501_21630 [Baekduia sp.]|uniref:hypothetical protein n=1 Tax=Baekduia sp. TaxID=2600305 RepID=UPI002BF12B22|nr:hypothetical protein [Baekduia sp.]HMJ36520.1 hypothetical protein [Baekduia sp.]
MTSPADTTTPASAHGDPHRQHYGLTFAVLALAGAIFPIGGGLGIVLDGPIVDAFSYHWLFWFPLVLVMIATVMTIIFMPESPVKVPGRINWAGAALLSAWLVCLLVAQTLATDAA